MKNNYFRDVMIKMTLIPGIFFFAVTDLFAQAEKQLVIGEQPVYKVARASEPIIVDGKMDEAAWAKAEVQSLSHIFRLAKPVE